MREKWSDEYDYTAVVRDELLAGVEAGVVAVDHEHAPSNGLGEHVADHHLVVQRAP